MGKTFSEIDGRMRDFIARQHLFFVATAPSGNAGHVNCSPKGLDTFRILDNRTVAYLDFVGSGAETIAHLRDNGRIVIMFCAFDGPPGIIRFHGTGEVVLPGEADFEQLMEHFAPGVGIRSVIRVHVTRISDSCGYGVPRLSYQGDRDQLPAWASRKGKAGLLEYQRDKNAASIDGLPALTPPQVPEPD